MRSVPTHGEACPRMKTHTVLSRESAMKGHLPNRHGNAKRSATSLEVEAAESARSAGMRYVTDAMPGFRRVHTKSGFRYLNVKGKPLRNRAELQRIKSLAIPPAWTNVWICPLAKGHLQATGRDARGRKQFRYHPKWRSMRDENKFDRMVGFGIALPRLRARIKRDLKLPGLRRERVLATILRLLETTLIRVGNEEYARHNGSVGLTTMRTRHVDISGQTLRFQFRGKSGVEHCVEIQDPQLARIVKRCQDLPGQELFQYRDENGKRRGVGSSDVNDYLREITGQEFTAKDFRTWAGTLLAASAFREIADFHSRTQAKRNVMKAIEAVAKKLGNTKTICRKCYIHPALIESYLDGTFATTLKRTTRGAHKTRGLRSEEAAVLAFLKKLKKQNGNKRVPMRISA
jgi:DNA topoisomerase-1